MRKQSDSWETAAPSECQGPFEKPAPRIAQGKAHVPQPRLPRPRRNMKIWRPAQPPPNEVFQHLSGGNSLAAIIHSIGTTRGHAKHDRHWHP